MFGPVQFLIANDALFWMQDTVTGFLLAGVGNVDLRKKTNFLVVNESELLILNHFTLRALHSNFLINVLLVHSSNISLRAFRRDFCQKD